MDWQTILWIVVALAAAAFVKWGIPYIKSKVDVEKLNKILAEIKDLVELAEKLFGTGNNDTKLDYVFNEIKKYDFKISDGDLLNLIKEAFSVLYSRLASEGVEIPTNKVAIQEYADTKVGKHKEEFETSVLAASCMKFEDYPIKQKKKSAKKTTKE